MKGVIAAGDPYTAKAGAAILEQGGNAVDAAVAAGFAAFICEALVVNIGGSGFALVVDPNHADGPLAYDFFSTMPQHRPVEEMDFRQVLIDFGGDTQPFFIGRASTAVPGAVKGLCTMAAERGTLPLAKLLEPAIGFAKTGVPLLANKTYILSLLAPIYRDTPELEHIFMPGGKPLQEGDLVNMSQLVPTLERLAREGPDCFYAGALAREIVADQQAHGGLVTHEDLAAYEVLSHEPIRVAYRDYTVLLTPPASLGGVLIGFALRLLESVSLTGLKPNGYEHLRILAHVMRLTNLARKNWHGDADAGQEKIARFLSDEHLAPFAKQLQEALNQPVEVDEPPEPRSPGNTTHISVMDAMGGCVSMTLSTGECAGYLVGDTGICLNNLLGEHDLNPHGFHQDPAGTRLISMMTPIVLMDGDKPVLATGSAGSNRIRSALLQNICNAVDFGFTPDRAVNQPRAHFEAGTLQLEAGIDPDIAARLGADGFSVNLWKAKNLYFGGAQTVGCLGGEYAGGADLRRDGAVIVI